MTAATREALLKVKQTLHEAGWDQPEPKPAGLTDIKNCVRTIYDLVNEPGNVGGKWSPDSVSRLRDAVTQLRTLTEQVGPA